MLTLILGGARSGKSRLAQRLAVTASKTDEALGVTYVATYHAAGDPEMTERIARHRASRPAEWKTIEEPVELAAAVETASRESKVILVDCLTIWLSNLFWEHRERPARHVEEALQAELNRIAELAHHTEHRCHIMLVSNEVGSGVVPEHALARAFRDMQGLLNQWAAEAADEVILTVAGLPLNLKTAVPPRDPGIVSTFDQTLHAIRPIDPQWIESARKRQLELTKPPGSLGRLEEIANRCCAIRETLRPTTARPRIVLFAADHGVCAEGVSAYPQEVTAQMVLNFLRGGAAINAFARTGEIELQVVDVGVTSPLPASKDLPKAKDFLNRRVQNGTRNFCVEPAMTEAEMLAALDVGLELARDAVLAGYDLLGFGEMGIGNTTSASAIAAALSGRPVDAVIGAGAGADDVCMARKRAAIVRALKLHSANLSDALGILRCVGGLEIAAMCGFCLGAAAHRVPVVTDGFIATAAAVLAVQMSPAVAGYLFASHRSAEAGHAHFLAMIDQQPVLDLGMRLGEGTGTALAMKLIQASVAAFTGMATFASAGVSNK